MIVLTNNARGQETDSMDNSSYFKDFHNIIERQKDFYYQPDSLLQEAFFYDRVKQFEVFTPRTGNLGSAHLDFFEKFQNKKILSDGFTQYDEYILDPFRKKTNSALRRFSNINYHIGSKKEQHLVVRHEQKIRPWMIMGLDLAAITSEGDFSQTINKNREFDLYFSYESRSGVYRGYVSYTANRVLNEESGGISDDAVFENASFLNTKTLPINLQSGETKHRTRDYVLKQELNLSRLFGKRDSVSPSNSFKNGSFVLQHSLWWNRKSILFQSKNPDSDYFSNIYFDSSITYDSSFYNDLYQSAMIEYVSAKSASGVSFNIGAGVEYQDVRFQTGSVDSVFYYSVDTSFYNNAAIATAGFTTKHIITGFSISKSINGDFDNTYRSQLNVNYSTSNQSNFIYLLLGAAKRSQTAKDRLLVSNHFIWNNDFDDSEEYDLTAGFRLDKLSLVVTARSKSVKNMVFYREDYLPQQFGDFVNVSDLTFSNIFRFGKFGFDDKFTLSTTSNREVAPVPAVSLFTAIYYQNRFFKNVLGFKAGIDLSYYSKYYGYGYMPATGVFYVQEEKKIGNYPQLGAFVNLGIKKSARIFIRLDHFNSGMNDRKYYGALHYPLPGRTFKFGVSWDLVN